MYLTVSPRKTTEWLRGRACCIISISICVRYVVHFLVGSSSDVVISVRHLLEGAPGGGFNFSWGFSHPVHRDTGRSGTAGGAPIELSTGVSSAKLNVVEHGVGAHAFVAVAHLLRNSIILLATLRYSSRASGLLMAQLIKLTRVSPLDALSRISSIPLRSSKSVRRVARKTVEAGFSRETIRVVMSACSVCRKTVMRRARATHHDKGHDVGADREVISICDNYGRSKEGRTHEQAVGLDTYNIKAGSPRAEFMRELQEALLDRSEIGASVLACIVEATQRIGDT